MKIAIMQPYFFPYLGYYSLIKHTDSFILFDTPQYIRHGWINRNRIYKLSGGFVYINVPISKYHRNTEIKDVRINNSYDWKTKIISQLGIYRQRAKNYLSTMQLIDRIFSKDYDSIVELNRCAIVEVCNYLDIAVRIQTFSQMKLPIKSVEAPDEWALYICKSLDGVDEYWNPVGGATFFDRMKYKKNNVLLRFHNINLKKYRQHISGRFESGLSIIDVMMHNDKHEINMMLDDYEILD